MTQEQRERLEQLAEFHEGQEGWELAMYTFGSRPDCGCSLHWACRLFPPLRPLLAWDLYHHALRAAVDFFGLERKDATALFGSEQRSPQEQARLLRRAAQS